MSTANTDAHNLFSQDFGGLINEDVIQAIQDISHIPLPFSDMVGRDDVSNQYTEWTVDRLQDPDITNKHVDGADVDQNDDNLGDRQGNHAQISLKEIKVSSRADAVDTIGYARRLGYGIFMRTRELRRDIEAIQLTGQASVRGTDTVEGQSGGLAAWISTTNSLGATGVVAGFVSTTGLVTAKTDGTKRAGSEAVLRQLIEDNYVLGGNASVIMSGPKVISGLNQYLVANAAARIATLEANVSGSSGDRASGSNQGATRGNGMIAKGYVNVYVSDHGKVVEIHDNRLQQPHAGDADAYDMFLLDPAYLRHGVLRGERVEPLAKQGLSERRMMSKDWTLKVLNQEAHAMYADIDSTLAWVA